jgi:hypothetical protein
MLVLGARDSAGGALDPTPCPSRVFRPTCEGTPYGPLADGPPIRAPIARQAANDDDRDCCDAGIGRRRQCGGVRRHRCAAAAALHDAQRRSDRDAGQHLAAVERAPGNRVSRRFPRLADEPARRRHRSPSRDELVGRESRGPRSTRTRAGVFRFAGILCRARRPRGDRPDVPGGRGDCRERDPRDPERRAVEAAVWRRSGDRRHEHADRRRAMAGRRRDATDFRFPDARGTVGRAVARREVGAQPQQPLFDGDR